MIGCDVCGCIDGWIWVMFFWGFVLVIGCVWLFVLICILCGVVFIVYILVFVYDLGFGVCFCFFFELIVNWEFCVCCGCGFELKLKFRRILFGLVCWLIFGDGFFLVGFVFFDNFVVSFCIKFIFFIGWLIGVDSVFFKIGFVMFFFEVLKVWGGWGILKFLFFWVDLLLVGILRKFGNFRFFFSLFFWLFILFVWVWLMRLKKFVEEK